MGTGNTNTTRSKVIYLIQNGKTNKQIADKLGITIRTVERYRKEYSETMDNSFPTDTKIKKSVARALITTGATIRDTAKKVGLPRSTVADLSTDYKLQKKQREFLEWLELSQRQKILKNKLKRLEINNSVVDFLHSELEKGNITKDFLFKLKLNEEIEQLILEKDRLIQLESLEAKKQAYSQAMENKTISVLDKLEEVLKDG